MKFQKTILALAMSSALIACDSSNSPRGNGGDNNGGGDGGGTTPPAEETNVTGVLDPVQDTLATVISSSVTPVLEETGLLTSLGDDVEQLVVQDTVDLVDILVNFVSDSATTQEPDFQTLATDLFDQLALVGTDLQTLVEGLLDSDVDGAEELLTLLDPILGQLEQGEPGDDRDLEEVSEITSSLLTAITEGANQVPAEVYQVPVLGGVFTTLVEALEGVDTIVNSVATYDGATASENVSDTLNNVLVNVLTEVIPVNAIEEATDSQGTVSGPIQTGVDQITDNLQPVLSGLLEPTTGLLDDQLSGILDPIENQILTPLLDTLFGSLTDSLFGLFQLNS